MLEKSKLTTEVRTHMRLSAVLLLSVWTTKEDYARVLDPQTEVHFKSLIFFVEIIIEKNSFKTLNFKISQESKVS